jgi:hypothetical protein
VLRDLGGIVRALQPSGLPQISPGQLEAALTDKTVDVWIGVGDALPRRATARLAYNGGIAELRALRSGSIDLDLRFSALGEPATITAPASTTVLDLTRLRRLAGGT